MMWRIFSKLKSQDLSTSISLIIITGLISACSNTALSQNPNTLNSTLDISQTNVFATKTQKWITPKEMVKELANTPIILLGEKHDEKKQHLAEVQMIRLLQPLGLKSVALEMFATSQQSRLTQGQQQIRQQKITNPTQIANDLNWDRKWDWQQYQPLITYLAPSSINLYGANLNQNEINTILQGAYPLKGYLSTTPNVKAKLQQIITGEHQISTEFADKLVMAQQFKDRRMAETLLRNPQPILLIAGRFHVSKKVGVPLHLQDYQQPNYQVIILTKDKKNIDPNETDYIWVVK